MLATTSACATWRPAAAEPAPSRMGALARRRANPGRASTACARYPGVAATRAPAASPARGAEAKPKRAASGVQRGATQVACPTSNPTERRLAVEAAPRAGAELTKTPRRGSCSASRSLSGEGRNARLPHGRGRLPRRAPGLATSHRPAVAAPVSAWRAPRATSSGLRATPGGVWYAESVSSFAERAARRRATWSFGRDDDVSATEEADIDFWLSIPMSERAVAAWQLSDEVYGWLSESHGEIERRLPRSALRIIRREG